MKAYLLKERGKIVECELPIPEIRDDEVLVRVRACAICGSDVHGYSGRTDRRRPPVIMGHEAAGEIARIGGKVARWHESERVTFNSTWFCGECWYCSHGRQNLCMSSRVFGVHCADYKLDGAMAEYVAVPARLLYRIPENVDFATAALAEPFSIALHAVGRTPTGIGDSAAVIGTGPIGLMIIKALQCRGIGEIAAFDISDARLLHAAKCGATATFNTAGSGWREAFRARWPQGVDHAFEAVGAAEPVNNAIDLSRRGGSVTLVGNAAPSGQIDFQKIVLKELNVIGSYACANEYETALRLIAGNADMGEILSRVAPIGEAQRWFDELREGKSDVVKVVLTF